jgi:hypothetical protein
MKSPHGFRQPDDADFLMYLTSFLTNKFIDVISFEIEIIEDKSNLDGKWIFKPKIGQVLYARDTIHKHIKAQLKDRKWLKLLVLIHNNEFYYFSHLDDGQFYFINDQGNKISIRPPLDTTYDDYINDPINLQWEEILPENDTILFYDKDNKKILTKGSKPSKDLIETYESYVTSVIIDNL